MKLFFGQTRSELDVLTVAEVMSQVRGKHVRFVYQTEEEVEHASNVDHHAVATAVGGPYDNTTGGNIAMVTVRNSEHYFSSGDALADALEALHCPDRYATVGVEPIGHSGYIKNGIWANERFVYLMAKVYDQSNPPRALHNKNS